MVTVDKKKVDKKKQQQNLKGRTLCDILHEWLMRRKARFCYFKFSHSCQVSERQGRKRERQVMPPLVLLIKFILL